MQIGKTIYGRLATRPETEKRRKGTSETNVYNFIDGALFRELF
jgi:hypothetical protein